MGKSLKTVYFTLKNPQLRVLGKIISSEFYAFLMTILKLFNAIRAINITNIVYYVYYKLRIICLSVPAIHT